MTAHARLPPFPRGWYFISLSEELDTGAVRPVHVFGRDLVLWRAESGEAGLFDAYCPHLGAHLGHGGVVEGEALRCPFHGWGFGLSGSCVAIPYSDRIPAKARLARWPLHEADGLLFAYHDEAGEPPTFEPLLPLVGEPGWTTTRVLRWELRAHVQDLVEGGIDTAHLETVHQAAGVDPCELEAEGEELHCRTRVYFGELGMGTDAKLICRGLGCVITTLENPSMNARSVLLPTPLTEDSVGLCALLSVRETPNPRATAAIEEAFVKGFVEDLERDRRIWEHKIFRSRPVLCPGDGPIAAFRRWAKQFHSLASSRTLDSVTNS